MIPGSRIGARKVFSSHKHYWIEVSKDPKYIKGMRNVVGSIKRKHEDPSLDLLKLNDQRVKNFIRKESRIWECTRCGLIQYADDMPDEDGET